MEDGSRKKWLMCAMFGIAIMMMAGCAKKIQTTQIGQTPPAKLKQEMVTPSPPPVKEQPKPVEKAPAAPLPAPAQLADIFFDFDRALLRTDSREPLGEDVRWMKENPASQITIEGHCDERGTGEYNLVLGEKRATAVKRYLSSEGISQGRIKTISYGRERPFCRAHTEQCWQENRRVHFVKAK